MRVDAACLDTELVHDGLPQHDLAFPTMTGSHARSYATHAASLAPLPTRVGTWVMPFVGRTKHDILALHVARHECEDRVVPRVSARWVTQHDTYFGFCLG
jgi:hypothetical protein